ncbi:MAG: patatin-like phospholipase family protein [Oscillospiraceae bacterium]|nr:patatin-like phospholipase family protein [Oscillospiraceae bacterium]
MGKKAVVLGGGGSRGSYQVGIWRALDELGFDYEIVTGTSVGALNGALMTQRDIEKAEEMWAQIKTADIMDIDVTDTVGSARDFTGKLGAFLGEMAKNGGADPRPLEEMLRRFIDEDKIRRSNIDFSFVTVEYPSLTAKFITRDTLPEGELVDFLMASAACFPAMKARVIGDKKYLDGGYQDNVPVELAIDMGADDIIAVDLEAIGRVRPVRNAGGVRIRTIRSRWDLGVFILFDSATARRNMRLGYLDAMKEFGRLDGWAYAFHPGEIGRCTKRLEKYFDMVSAKTGLYLAKARATPMEAIARKKLGELALRIGRVTPENLTLAGMESAGRIFGLSPEEVYTAEEFNARLAEALGALPVMADAAVLSAMEAVKKPKELRKLIRMVDKRHVVSFCYQQLGRLFAGRENSAARAILLAAAVPEAFLAACYFYLLYLEEIQG